MNIKLLSLLVAIYSPIALSANQSIQAIKANTEISEDINAGTVVFKITDNLSPHELKSLNGLLNSQGLVEQKTLSGSQIIIATFAHHGKEKAIANILKNSSLVEFAEPDYAVTPTQVPNDPGYGDQWHHQTVNSPQAWDVTTGSKSVLTAVCDTGFDTDHPDLSGNLRLDLAYNAQDDSDYVEDANGHGTGSAGTLGAVGNNARGVAGVNWNVDIIPVRIAISDSNSSAYISTMAKCIEYAADNGARIVNLSYGGIQYSTINSAAQYLRAKGGLLFMSAGNDNVDNSNFPDYLSFIGVGATNQQNNKASFSSWGTYVDITAPGVSILTTYKNGQYVYYSGTSFSSPLTAGIAALMVAANPAITVEEIENGLFSTATDIGASGDDNVFGHGLVNAQAAIDYATNLSNLSPPIADISILSTSVPYDEPVILSAIGSSDDNGIVSYQWSLGDGTSNTSIDVNHIYGQAGNYQVTLTVTDADGLSDSDSVNVQVTTDLPIAVITPTPNEFNIGDSIDFDGSSSSDADGEISHFDWELGDSTTKSGITTSHTYNEAGNYTVRLTVTDNAGAMNSTTTDISIVDPSVLNAPSAVAAQVDGLSVSLSWTDNSSNEDNFIVERGVKFRGRVNFSEVITLSPNSESYVDTVPESGQYRYRIKAVNTSSEATSETITVQADGTAPDPDPETLPAPSNLSLSLSGMNVSLTWTDNSNNETGFHIERGRKARGRVTFSRIASIAANENTYVDSLSGEPNGNYVYRVQAYNDDGVSSFSDQAEVRLK